MKPALTRISIILLVLAVGFFAGKCQQDFSEGYRFEVRDEKKYDSPMGDVRWRYVTECVGSSFMDPGTTVIEFKDRTIFKSKRYFQESVPFAQNIETSGNTIRWDDGEYRFNLTLEEMGEKPDTPVTK